MLYCNFGFVLLFCELVFGLDTFILGFILPSCSSLLHAFNATILLTAYITSMYATTYHAA